MAVAHVAKDGFRQEVLSHKGVVLVDFYAEWCGPCKIVAPLVEEISNEMPEVKFVKVSVDENPDLASQYSIFSIPTFLIFKDGQMVSQFAGALGKDGIAGEIKKAAG
jgi:thioredoxin 1